MNDTQRLDALQSLWENATRDLVISTDRTEDAEWYEDTRVHGDDHANTVLLVRPGETLRTAIDKATQAAA